MELKDLRKENLKPGNKEAAKYIDKLYDETSKMYLKQHRDWYVNERFVRGDHWVVYNKTLNKVQVLPLRQGEIRRTVNKINAQIRGVKNFIKRAQPRWEAHPSGASDKALKEAITKNKLLQNIYDRKKFPILLTDIIVNSLKYSAGILEVGIKDDENGNVDFDFWVDDTFDVFFDPFAPDIQSCRYIIKAFKKPTTSINNNPNYTIKGNNVISDNKGAATQYKELLELEKYGRDTSRGSNDLESTIVKEVWIKWKEDGETKIRILTLAGDKLVRVENTNYKKYPMFVYNPERDANSIYSNAWIKELISPNKSLDKMVSQIEAYIQRMLAGKYLIKQGVEVSQITDKGAEFIYYKGSTPPSQQQLQPLPSTPFNHVVNLEKWIEEFGGIRAASLGRAPGSIQSGKALEALQTSDSSNVSEPIENLEYFLKEIGEFILEVVEDQQITTNNFVQDNEEFKYIGASVGKTEGVVPIKKSDVSVKIVPEISYDEDSKREWLVRLAEGGLIDPKTLLEKMQISNISQVVERMQQKKEEDLREEMVKQRESHRTQGEGPEDTADLADQENMQMAASQPPPPTPRALWTPEHTELHMAFIQQNQDAYKQNKEIFDEHIANEEKYQ